MRIASEGVLPESQGWKNSRWCDGAGSPRISPGRNGVRGTGAEAKARAAKVQNVTAGGEIRATASDEILEKTGVSFEVFTPGKTNIKASAHNGSVAASKVEGRIQMTTHNGSVKLGAPKGYSARLHAGSDRGGLLGGGGPLITATTHNGGVAIEQGPVRD